MSNGLFWFCLILWRSRRHPGCRCLKSQITCCILHNSCILRGDELDDSDYSSDDDDDEDNDNPPAAFGQGRIIRQAITAFLAS